MTPEERALLRQDELEKIVDKHMESASVQLFGCCSYEDTWFPGIKGWGASDKESRESGYVYFDEVRSLLQAAVKEALAAARAGERWIPVSAETMPEYDVDVVLWNAAWGRSYIGYWRHSEEWIGRQRPEESAPLPNTNPTHWRNLPEPPAELFPVAESETNKEGS